MSSYVKKPVWPATCLVCLAEPVLLLREWVGLNVLAGDLSKPLITDWLLLSGGGHTWGSIGSMCWGKRCMEFVMESEVVVCHGREHSTEGQNKQSNHWSFHGYIKLTMHIFLLTAVCQSSIWPKVFLCYFYILISAQNIFKCVFSCVPNTFKYDFYIYTIIFAQ